MRLRIDLAYDGTEFHGWATQPGLRTVQEVVEERIGQLLRLPEAPTLVVAGRTDAGVHARGQVCHVDLPLEVDAPVVTELHRRLRRALPRDLSVRSVRVAPEGFDARFSALRRHYEYRLTTAPWGPDPTRARTVAWNTYRAARTVSNEQIAGSTWRFGAVDALAPPTLVDIDDRGRHRYGFTATVWLAWSTGPW